MNYNIGKNNPIWKEVGVKKGALHEYVSRRMPLPKKCIDCGSGQHIDLANKGIYDRNLDNWKWQCRRCHMKEDGRMDSIHKPKTPLQKQCENCLEIYRRWGGHHTQRFCSLKCYGEFKRRTYALSRMPE